MSQGVLLKETVVASNAQAKALMGRTEVNKKAVRPDHRGIVPDTLGAISTDPGVRRFLNQNQLNAHFTQTITIYGTVGGEYRTALTLRNEYTLTNAGVTVKIGVGQQHKRPQCDRKAGKLEVIRIGRRSK